MPAPGKRGSTESSPRRRRRDASGSPKRRRRRSDDSGRDRRRRSRSRSARRRRDSRDRRRRSESRGRRDRDREAQRSRRDDREEKKPEKVDPFGFGDSDSEDKKKKSPPRGRDPRDNRGGKGFGGKGGMHAPPPPMTEEEREAHEKMIREFAENQGLDDMAVQALKRAHPEATKWVCKMDLSSNSGPSRLVLLCLRDAMKAIHCTEETKEQVAKFCTHNKLSARIQVMLMSIPESQREAVIRQGSVEPRIKNRSGYIMGRIQQARQDDIAAAGRKWDCPRCNAATPFFCHNCRECGYPNPNPPDHDPSGLPP